LRELYRLTPECQGKGVHRRIACKINEVPGVRRARICCLEPQGLGKPEPLKFGLPGWWSRRISGEHRLVYRVSGKGEQQQLDIVQCRHHY
jgi:Txe/YoeB family toxin of toxin-antitoxin system